MTKARKPSDPHSIKDTISPQRNATSFRGVEVIKYFAKNLPSKPGVYQMESEKGEILYIGKQKIYLKE